MSNYKQASVEGEIYTRCNSIHLNNQLGATPTMTFQEETILTIPGEQIHRGAGGFTVSFNPSDTITLINPVDNTPLGFTATHAELQVMLYSLYIQEAKKRDGA